MKPCTMVYTWTYLFTKLHGVTPKKTVIFRFTDVSISKRKLKNFQQNANNRIHFIKKYIPSALLNYDWSLNPAVYQRVKFFFIVAPCILTTLMFLSPTIALPYYTYKTLKYTAKIYHDCSYMFRSIWTIIREPMPNLAKVTTLCRYSAKTRR